MCAGPHFPLRAGGKDFVEAVGFSLSETRKKTLLCLDRSPILIIYFDHSYNAALFRKLEVFAGHSGIHGVMQA